MSPISALQIISLIFFFKEVAKTQPSGMTSDFRDRWILPLSVAWSRGAKAAQERAKNWIRVRRWRLTTRPTLYQLRQRSTPLNPIISRYRCNGMNVGMLAILQFTFHLHGLVLTTNVLAVVWGISKGCGVSLGRGCTMISILANFIYLPWLVYTHTFHLISFFLFRSFAAALHREEEPISMQHTTYSHNCCQSSSL